LRGRHVPMYPSPEGSPIWVSFWISWLADGPLDESGMMSVTN
jgi:hypothetical protein